MILSADRRKYSFLCLIHQLAYNFSNVCRSLYRTAEENVLFHRLCSNLDLFSGNYAKESIILGSLVIYSYILR